MPRVPVEIPQTDGSSGTTHHDQDAAHPEVGQYYYTAKETQKLTDDPEYLLNYRKRIEYGINMGFAIFYKGMEPSRMAEEYMRAEMTRRLQGDSVLTKELIPSWPVGCR